MATIFFGNGDDEFTPADDVPAADDEFHGGFGNDTLTGDSSFTSGGSDTIFGDQGADRLIGHRRGDYLYGGNGQDVLYGDDVTPRSLEGDDYLNGGAGADTIFGGGGNDTADYSDSPGAVVVRIGQISEGSDAAGDQVAIDVENIRGSAFDDVISGSSIGNLLEGLAGDDRLFGNEGDDTFYAGDGEFDYMVGGAGADGFYGGGGAHDTASYVSNAVGISVEIGVGVATGGDAAGDFIAVSVEDVWGSDLGDDVIYGSGADNTLRGNGGSDYLWGKGGNDRLTGGAGDDFLVGDQGVDILEGGLGTDTAIFLTGVQVDLLTPSLNSGEAAGDSLYSIENLSGSVSADVLSGDDEDNGINGNAGNDHLSGRLGSDRLDGGDGIDTLEGGGGGDTYILDDTQTVGSLGVTRYDTVIEASGGGLDTVLVNSDAPSSSVVPGYTLTDNVEIGRLTGSTAFRLTGNGSDNTLEGNTAANALSGLDGDDSLNGREGEDTLTGGAGSDFYRLDDVWQPDPISSFRYDTVNEAAGGGTADWVAVMTGLGVLGYTLGDNVEIGSLLGDAAFSLSGNELGNTLRGNDAANGLNGLDGNDKLFGGLGADGLEGGLGNDRYYLYDVAGASTISAGAYDSVIEAAAGGIDTVVVARDGARLSYTLAANVENGIVSGGETFGLRGNEASNVLTGQNGSNALSGLAGNDTLRGLDGDDELTGGAGNDLLSGDLGRDILNGGDGRDVFDFDLTAETGVTASTRDVITLFTHLIDEIDLGDIDADTGTAGNQDFIFRGTAGFTGVGQIRLVQDGANAIVVLNTTGAAGAEATIQINNFTASSMTADDFGL